MNIVAFSLLAIFTLLAAAAAAVLPRLIHAALCLALAFVGVAMFYALLGAEFVGLVQILVYVGAVAVLIVFTILLTHRGDEKSISAMNWGGVSVAIAVFGGLLWAIMNTPALTAATAKSAPITVKQIGITLTTAYMWPLQCTGILLTAAFIGALILVMEEKR
ncbi:MAG: NADH-quinone oxidoreductase subunit J [Chthoniobacteraceae bacterium]